MVLLRLLSVLFLLSAGCGPRVFTEGEYDDPEKVDLLSDQFTDSDMRMMSDTLVQSLLKDPIVDKANKKPVIQVESVHNRTSEHVDMKSLTDKILVALSKSKKLTFHHKELRETVKEEYEYQQSGVVKPETAKGPGEQIGADYLLSGDLASSIQRVGDKEIIYYKLTLKVTNLKSNLVAWTDEAEVKKRFRKKRVSP